MPMTPVMRPTVALCSAALVGTAVAVMAAPATAAPKCTYTFDPAGGTYDGDTVKAGDDLCGGPGDDYVPHMSGGIFIGGPGDDMVSIKEGGRFYGNLGDERIKAHRGGRFIGGFGADLVGSLEGGAFEGGPGAEPRLQGVRWRSLRRWSWRRLGRSPRLGRPLPWRSRR